MVTFQGLRLTFLLASPVASDRFDYNYRCYSTRKTEVFASLKNSYRTLQHVAKKHSFLLNTDLFNDFSYNSFYLNFIYKLQT